MTDATNANSAKFVCNGFAERNLEELGIDPSAVRIKFDEIVEVDNE